MWQLIACRALMGAAAALIMPSTLSILVNVFPAQERAKAIAIWAGTTGAAGAIGPVASGWLLGYYWFGDAINGASTAVQIVLIAFAVISFVATMAILRHRARTFLKAADGEGSGASD